MCKTVQDGEGLEHAKGKKKLLEVALVWALFIFT